MRPLAESCSRTPWHLPAAPCLPLKIIHCGQTWFGTLETPLSWSSEKKLQLKKPARSQFCPDWYCPVPKAHSAGELGTTMHFRDPWRTAAMRGCLLAILYSPQSLPDLLEASLLGLGWDPTVPTGRPLLSLGSQRAVLYRIAGSPMRGACNLGGTQAPLVSGDPGSWGLRVSASGSLFPRPSPRTQVPRAPGPDGCHSAQSTPWWGGVGRGQKRTEGLKGS